MMEAVMQPEVRHENGPTCPTVHSVSLSQTES